MPLPSTAKRTPAKRNTTTAATISRTAARATFLTIQGVYRATRFLEPWNVIALPDVAASENDIAVVVARVAWSNTARQKDIAVVVARVAWSNTARLTARSLCLEARAAQATSKRTEWCRRRGGARRSLGVVARENPVDTRGTHETLDVCSCRTAACRRRSRSTSEIGQYLCSVRRPESHVRHI